MTTTRHLGCSGKLSLLLLKGRLVSSKTRNSLGYAHGLLELHLERVDLTGTRLPDRLSLIHCPNNQSVGKKSPNQECR